jgi:Holliday junction resolvase
MTPQTPYEKGRDLEYKAKELMESYFGCYVIRSAGSHTPVDLICGNGIDVYAVQVKFESVEKRVDWNKLREYAEALQAIPTLLVYCTGGRWKIYFDERRWTKYDEDR